MKRVFIICLICAVVMSCAYGEGLLPSLTSTVGIAMPSLGDVLRSYPDFDIEGPDGSISETYLGVTESAFEAFSVYLEEQGAVLSDYDVEGSLFTATIEVNGGTFGFTYDIVSKEAVATYPAGAYGVRLKRAKEHYQSALSLLEEGKTDEAYAELSAVDDYMNYGPIRDLIASDEGLMAASAARAASFTVGNYVTFGAYPQTASGADNKAIEWLVLAREGNRVLLLSRYGLDVQPYNEQRIPITWEDCTLRIWLNDTFLNRAFNASEQAAILTTSVSNDAGQGYAEWKTDGGNDTQDRIFLLSYAEANRYLGVTRDDRNNVQARVAPTAYAMERWAGIYVQVKTAADDAAGWWWLRSSGLSREDAAYVNYNGSLNSNYVSYFNGSVRPAFWLDLESVL